MKAHSSTRIMLIVCSGISMTASGQQGIEDSPAVPSRWTISIVTGFEREPVYTGSDVYVSEADVNLEAVYRASDSLDYVLSLGEIGAVKQLNENSVLSTVLEYEFGRDNADDQALQNFPEVEDTVEAQAVYMREVGPIMLGAGLQYDILNRGKGLVGFVGAAYRTALTDNISLQSQLDLSFADAEHLQTEVGISPATAALTGYGRYSPDSGYKGATLSLDLDVQFSRHWSMLSSVSVERYSSIMADSPLIAVEGTDTTYEAAVGIRYGF